ncbi:hypothetical protein [Bythopirellula goksoeyrii]|uniref:Peptidase C39-like domain-containing protein n=1 Tax=Bythopirellula goksoeyrii TaxID=1400387 RepID=A0A5B9QFY5_9BACT|nr:hypothetical protein [Bythopirellula goksoeyrii]QEG37967.1 hypothetical protein Pr1d_53150 [Bythopirellula goksoeyrii]
MKKDPQVQAQRVSIRLGVVGLTLCVAACELIAEERLNTKFDERVESTPDLPQDQRSLPGNGDQYCAPVSASNGLIWLAEQGYPNLMRTNQIDLAKELGSPSFMNTSVNNGTGVKDVGLGLGKYVTVCGYEIQDLAYQSWRSKNKRSIRKIPGHANPVSITRGLRKDSIVLLNIGWYKQSGNDYERLSGHWVTLAGAGKEDAPILFVHDPSGRSPEGQHERVSCKRIRTGKLVGSDEYLPLSAKGAWQLGGELKLKTNTGADTAILDGAIMLRIK